MSQTAKTPISKKLQQLDTAIDWFYSDDFELDEALKRYESAIKLSAEIEEDLNSLKNQVQVIADLTKTVN